MMFRTFAASVALATSLSYASAALAIPTPEPGGANQTHGVAGPLGATLFNGQTRVRQMKLDKPNGSADESYPDTSDQKWIVLRAVMSNGMPHVLTMSQFSATIVDADGISIAAQPDKVRPIGTVTGIPPGGAWRESVLFNVPATFVPVKIVLVPSDTHFKAFRISLLPTDLPHS